jgi:uncharacterized repeat protein (TIGR01451 family)
MALLCLVLLAFTARAGLVVNNNDGYFLDDYANSAGIGTAASVRVVAGGTVALISPGTAGNFQTVDVAPTSFREWNSLEVTPGSLGAAGDLTAEVRSQDGLTVLIPAQPVTAPISLAALNSPLVPGIRVRVYFTKSGVVAPTVDSLRVTWTPVSQVLVDKQGPVEVRAGDSFTYRLRYSVNYVRAENLVVWDKLPEYPDSLAYPTEINPTPYPGQDDKPLFLSATKGGLYHAGPGALLVDGVSVPAHSAYWRLATVDEGVTDMLQFTVSTRNGTLDGTRFTNYAHVAAANAPPTTSPPVITAVRATPLPSITKDGIAGIFEINGVLQTGAGFVNGFGITARNGGNETMYNSVVYDDVSGLIGMIDEHGTPGVPADDFLNISAGGAFVSSYTPPGGGAAFPAIVWNVGALEPGATFSASYSVALLAAPPQAQYVNTACLVSDQTTRVCDQIVVQVGLDQTPSGGFRKTAPTSVPHGGTATFGLSGRNRSAVKLNDMVFLDRVPTNTTFRSAWIDDPNLVAAGATIFYSTSVILPQDWNNPPPVDYTQAPADLDAGANTHWERYDLNPPANPGDVTWIAFFFPQMDSPFLPNQGTPALPPSTPITSVAGFFDVTVFTPPNPCDDYEVQNLGHFQVNEMTPLNGVKGPLPTGPFHSTDEKHVAVIGTKSVVSASSSISPGLVVLPGQANYSLTVANNGSDTLANVQAEVQLSQLPINGLMQFPSVQGISPAGTFDAVNGRIHFALGLMAPGASRSITVLLDLPAGIIDGTEFVVNAEVSGLGALCGAATDNTSARAAVESSPKLRVFKRDIADLIPSKAKFDYELEYSNLGTAPSTRTFVVDRAPDRTVFVKATGNSTVSRVWFSAVNSLPPQALSPLSPIDGTTIANNFSPGTLNDNGTPSDTSDDYWTSPFGTQTYWIAFEADDQLLNPPQFALNTPRTVGITVQNDNDAQGPGTDGSPEGTLLLNSAGIFSHELLQAIGNQVITTVKNQPSILVQKTGPSVVEAGVEFNWVVSYYNNSLTPAANVVVTDTLPPGITLLGVTHSWNAAVIGAPANNNNLPVPTSVVNNTDGSTTVTFVVAGASGYRGNGTALGALEGGVFTLRVTSDPATPSGTPRVNYACGTADSASESITSCDDHQVTIFRPDLQLLKYASPSSVLAGGTVTYQLVVANRGPINAREVALIDQLPAGVTYVPGSLSVLTPGYTLGAPSISGQTLTWSLAHGNALARAGLPAGEVPGASGNILIQFNVQVGADVPGCTTLENCAQVTTVSVEEGVYANIACASATVPPPELAIAKSGPALARPGNRVTSTITWMNESPQAASGVYAIDSLPHNDNDSHSDVTFVSVVVPSGVTAYYHSGPAAVTPAFNVASPTSGGWSATATTPVNHIAFLINTLAGNAGPFTAQVTVDLIDPVTRVLPAPGTSFTNRVVIAQAVPLCENTANNTATAIVRTPALDVSLTKKGSVEGSLPGIAPGQPITYTLTFENNGTVSAYGVRVTDTLPATLTPGSPLDDFTSVSLVDAAGNPVSPVDSSGAPIVGAVPVTRVMLGNVITWYLGTTTPGDALYYQRIGLPLGSKGSFRLHAKIAASVADSTQVCNPASVAADVGTEESLANNNSQSCVMVRRADVAVRKSGMEIPSGDPNFVEAGGLIRYKIEYNNLGSISAENVKIDEIIPPGTKLVSVNPPPGSTVIYSPSEAAATSFTVSFDSLSAPANTIRSGAASSSADNTPPTLDSVVAECRSNLLTLTFSERMDYDLATRAANYRILPNVAIQDLEFSADGRTVYLTTSPMALSNNYTLVATNLADAAGNRMTTNASVIFRCPTAPVITTQPVNATAEENHSATFSVVATGGSPLFYQWQHNGSNIPGATNATLVLPNVSMADNGSFYRVIVSNYLGTATSGSRALIVTPDTTAPTLVGLDAPLSQSLLKITLEWSEALDPTAATDPANYALGSSYDNAVPMPGLSVEYQGTNVVLTLAVSMVANMPYTLVINNQSDLALNMAGPVVRSFTPGAVNCCDLCTESNAVTYTNFAFSGYNYFVMPLCSPLTNYSLDTVLPVVPDATMVLTWNRAAQTWNDPATFIEGFGWVDGSFNPASAGLSPGEGFVLQAPTPFTFTLAGCEPVCPLPCSPLNGGTNAFGTYSLIGRFGIGTARYTNLFSCPPACGTRVLVWDPITQTNTVHDFLNGTWIPSEPIIPANASAFFTLLETTNCNPVVVPPTNNGDCLNVDTNGVHEAVILANPDRFIGWKMLFVEQTLPEGADIRYTIGRLDAGTAVFDLGVEYTSVSIGLDGLDLSDISPAYTNLVLRAEHVAGTMSVTEGTNTTTVTVRPCLKSWLATYDSLAWPSFEFTVRVNDDPCGGPLPIRNVVSISTTTPEISLDNNTASHLMNTRLTDLQVKMSVDKSAALIGATLTYTLDYFVAGPQSAPKTYLQFVLGDGDNNGSADLTFNAYSGVPAYYHTASTLTPPLFDSTAPTANGWSTSRSGANHVVFLLGDLAPNTSGSISFGATIKSGTAGRTLVSTVSGHTARRETVCDNTGSAITYVGNLANVYVQKSGPGCVHPGDLVTFTIRYGNIGNLAAANVVVNDLLPAGLTFVSATPAPSGPGLAWNNLGATAGTLAINETGVITVVAQLDNNYALVGQSIENVATIATSTAEANIADNRDGALLDCITADVVSLAGHTYHDRNNNGVRELASGETGIAGVTIALTGTDVFGKPVALSTITDGSGAYSFVGLNPGTYTLVETQPANWNSASDTLGTINGVQTGNNSGQLDNLLGTITLNGGNHGVDYNFGENCTEPLALVCPAPVNLACASGIPAPDASALTASAPCSACGPVTITWSGDTLSSSNSPGRFTITRAYRAADRCGNVATCQQIITVNDNVPPVITCPPNQALCQFQLYCGYTQGGWGSTPNGNNPGSLLANNFALVYRGGFVEIGIPGASGFSVKFTSAAAVKAFLPAGKSAKALTADATNPTSTSAGVFGGQVLALQLNVDFSDAGVTGGSSGTFGDLVLKDPASPLNGKTVRQILAIANTALGGGNVSSHGVSIATLNAIADSFNQAFDNCQASAWANSHITVPPVSVPPTAPATAVDNCDPNPVLTYSDAMTNGAASGTYLITRTWTATDASGNKATCNQLFTFAGRAPTQLTATPASGSVTLRWNASAAASSYILRRATAGGGYTVVAAGLTSTNFTDTTVVNGTVYYYAVSAVIAGAETCASDAVTAIPGAPLPSPWASKDIGQVAATGGVSHVSGTFTIVGSGADIAGTGDEFRFVYQTGSGDCSVVARVTSLGNTDAAAKAGVMIRESLNANARHASTLITPANGAVFSSRSVTGGGSSQVASSGPAAPVWLKVTRVGNTFTAYHSANGTTWTTIGSQTITMGATTYIGLGVTSHNDGALCPAVLDNVTATP